MSPEIAYTHRKATYGCAVPLRQEVKWCVDVSIREFGFSASKVSLMKDESHVYIARKCAREKLPIVLYCLIHL